MSPLYKYNGALLKIGDSLAIGEDCCCGEDEIVIQECSNPYVEGIQEEDQEPGEYGWQPAPSISFNQTTNYASITAAFKFQDSNGSGKCGLKSNAGQQVGSYSCQITLTETTIVYFTLSGLVETFKPYEDHSYIEVSIDGTFITPDPLNLFNANSLLEIYSTQDRSATCDLDSSCCLMELKSVSTNVSLDAGTYTIYFKSDSIDGSFHMGQDGYEHMTHTFSVWWWF